MMSTQKLIILDRDGVINKDSPDFIKSPAEYIPLPGSLEAIVLFKEAGWTVTVATNQSGIARGLFDIPTLNRIHEEIQNGIKQINPDCAIDGFFYCPHGPNDDCECRKPKPGLLHTIEKQYQLDFSQQQVPAIGDSLRDLEAAAEANCVPILVLTGNGVKTQNTLPKHLQNIAVFPNLLDAALYLVGVTQDND